jgi:hypothetical protein
MATSSALEREAIFASATEGASAAAVNAPIVNRPPRKKNLRRGTANSEKCSGKQFADFDFSTMQSPFKRDVDTTCRALMRNWHKKTILC